MSVAFTPSDVSSPLVILGNFGDHPLVLGKVKPRLTWAQYDVVQTLLEAGNDGLTKNQLDDVSGHCDARKILERLRKSDEDWATVIHMPGRPGLRYRIG